MSSARHGSLRFLPRAKGGSGIVQLASFTVATLPSASPAGRLIYVSDASGGAVPAFSDGTDWRRVDTSAVVT